MAYHEKNAYGNVFIRHKRKDEKNNHFIYEQDLFVLAKGKKCKYICFNLEKKIIYVIASQKSVHVRANCRVFMRAKIYKSF